MADAAVKRARAGQGSIRDRLSALPDELLLRVLSFLPAQEVVRTTVLSKRWTDLWRSVPGINLDYFGFGSNWERMVYFVDNLLMLHRAPCLDAFRLVAIVGGHHRHIDTWVRRAIRDDPLVIQITLGTSYPYQLPYLSSSPCRRLTSLHLHGMSLDHSFPERLHSWWPQLKDLTLINCRTVFSGIESDKLENLVLLNCIDQPGDVFAIKASHLASLSVLLRVPFTLDAGNSLVRASISLNCAEFCSRGGAILLSRLSNVTSLDLDGFQRMAALDREFDDVPIFHNLRTLSLGTCVTNNGTSDVCELKAVGRFLHKSPNLEKLTLKHFKVVLAVEHVDFPILENLRTLSLHYCDLHDNFQILLHCLWNSPNLEKVNITSCKLTNDPMGGKQKAKSKKTYSQSTNLARFQCLKLEYAEIIRCQEDAGVHELVSFLLDVAAPTVTIKVAKSLDCLPALP